jgi:hypothetical protein
MWWLELAGVVGFAVVLGTSFIAWRRHGTAHGRPATMGALLVGGLVVLAVGVYAIAATA